MKLILKTRKGAWSVSKSYSRIKYDVFFDIVSKPLIVLYDDRHEKVYIYAFGVKNLVFHGNIENAQIFIDSFSTPTEIGYTKVAGWHDGGGNDPVPSQKFLLSNGIKITEDEFLLVKKFVKLVDLTPKVKGTWAK